MPCSRCHDDATGWLELLSDARRKKISEEVQTAKEKDGFVSEIVCSPRVSRR